MKNGWTIQHPRLAVNLFDTLSELPSENSKKPPHRLVRLGARNWTRAFRTDDDPKQCGFDGASIVAGMSIETAT